MMFRRPLVVRRGPGLLGATAVGGAAQERRGDERIARLQELGRLRASGVLTDDEFLREKRRVLGGT